MEGRRKIIEEEEEEQMQRFGEWWNSSYTWIFFSMLDCHHLQLKS